MMPCNLRSLLLAAVVLSNCITWTASRHHYTHNVSGHRSRHRRQGAGLFLSASYVLPGGEGTGWGEWGEVSPCSRTCGGGVASQKRICLQIGPDGQPQCTGGDTKYFSCQTQDCPAGSKDFREQQCSEFDDVTFRDINYKWVPYTKAPNPCELNCMPHGERFYYRHRTKVVDGTRCNDESFDVCVNGTCQPVGCDMMLGSTAREDKCRECRGNGANCHTTTGILDTQDLKKGYNDMLLIPEGATTIVIAEIAPSGNYLALRAKNGTYYLNGDYLIDFPRSLTIAGALWSYERSQQGFAAPDKLRCLGPTNEPLYLALLLLDTNVGIEYEYSVPNELAPPRNKRYNWVHEEFTPCSATCGGGFQTRNVSCRSREELELVDEGLCDHAMKPPTNQSCNTDRCPAQWTPGPWGQCSKRCGKGGTKSREVHCMQVISNAYPSIVDEKECFDHLGPKPELFQKCNENATCPLWFTGPWKPCDKLCDEGKQTRQVVCYQKNGARIEVLGDEECDDEKPVIEQTCLLQPCDGVDWVLSEWSGCDTCLSTVRSRTAVCATKEHKVVNDSFCAYHATPETQQPCDRTKLPPCQVQWYATQWSKCSVDCGKGIQTRKVFCGLFDGASVLKVDDERCAGQTKYNDTKECEIPKDKCPSKWFSGPWSACTKKCGGGEQFRRVMCLRGGAPAQDCDGEAVLDSTQSCNPGPCDKDELLPVDEKSPAVVDDYEDCVEEEDYPEVGLDVDPAFGTTDDFMLSDSPSVDTSEGSGMWTAPTAEHESTFPDIYEFIPMNSGISTDLTDTSDESSTDDTGSGYESTTDLADTGSTESTITEETLMTETSLGSSPSSDSTLAETSGSTETEETGSTETTEMTETGSTETTEAGSTESTEKSDTGSTEAKETSENGSTETTEATETDSTETTETTETGSTEATETTETGSTETEEVTGTGSTEATETTETGSTEATETIETGSTDTTEATETGSTEATETTETGSTEATESTETESTESTNVTETGSTEATETTETGSTEATETTETGSTEATEITETGSTEAAETTETGSTEATGITETGSTEATDTTESSSTEATETTETGSTEATETGSTEATETTETGSTDATETTEAGSTEATETTETSSTEATEMTETGSTETTETGSTEATETTETGSTEATETTETGSTESTETTETGSTEATETTETGSTETTELNTGSTESTVTEETTTEVSGSTETTEEGSTVSTEATESSSESSTTEAATSSEGITRWDLSSTVEVYTEKKARVCKPRSCVRSEFGCCPDKKTPALGPFDDGCPKPHTCKESIYGCCPDGLSPAQGSNHKGCPLEPCAETLFGCCESDNKTAAQGNDQEGCPPPPPACFSSKYGCCKDDETEATGPGKEGCPETTETDTEETAETEETEGSTTTSPTASVDGCAGSVYGCCFDNETAATGLDLQGCPCGTSEFGCCLDGVAPAEGPNFEGCVKSCNASTYGCCPDNKTPAHGPDHEGCCLLYAFGCCPDNYKPAEGPHLEGCGCQFSRFGCCPDNVTVATGPDNKGCGCQYTEHGCCPDRHSEASGPEFEGCMCHTYQFGCCPDGVTVARGPHGQGCYCQQSTFGCCGDEQTHAKGPNKEGCDCSTSKHGCCPDGSTEATGPKFEGCTDKPENIQDACRLKFERGPCRNYSVNWFYDTEYGGCSRFWYGGCDGNGNRFGSKEECEDTCVTPPPKDACKLPQIKGACLGYNVRWYYDNEREACTNFVYGGCLGNSNNFETRELCQAQCEPERALDQCELAIERGTCAGVYPRWGFNKETRRCEQFTWGGCEGNTNRFSTEAACLLRCNPPGEPQPECSESQNVGNCTDTEALWSFSQSENRCVPFYYTGCGGNGNKFQSQEDCQQSCPSAFVPELCTLPAETGDCADYREKWYFDTKDQRCRLFYYGGCGGNGNNFNSEQECTNRCILPATTTVAPPAATAVTAAAPHLDPSRSEFCFLEIDAGPCNELETKWAYDYTKGKCVAFQYGGCGGNQNHFPSEEQCTYYCKPTQDICQLPMLAGPCDDSVMRWFYDAISDACSQFTYSGCGGNDNSFGSYEECQNRCMPATAPAPAPATPATTTTTETSHRADESIPPECAVPASLEPCNRSTAGEVWYYSPTARACAAHGNPEAGAECRSTGTFYSQEACERSCGVFRNIDVCRYPVEPGPCHDYRPKYHYNETSRRCEEFAYGGCLGGPNRFSSAQECEHICMTTVDLCSLPPETGNCVDRIVMWYYDQSGDQCYQFAYGGCGGNDNKFESREVCEGRCRKQPPVVDYTTTSTPAPIQQTTRQQEQQEECRTPASLEPCGTNITVFYFDEATSSCKAADIGGCRYYNSFRSEEECERRCGAFRGLDVCQTHLDPGPCQASISKFYFDVASGSCKSYAYGGCQGGPNRFSTSEECEEVCADAGPARECLQEVVTGERCAGAGAVPERRWHYDVARADCLVFAYQGCAGSQNNFRSYEECAELCRVAPPESEASRACSRYAEECSSLETSCVYGVKTVLAAEGCERCECEEPVNCDAQRRECDALRCTYGVERATAQDGCETCKCLEDPCDFSNCTDDERCVATASRDPITQEARYSTHCVPDPSINEVLCEAYTEECARLACPYGVQRTRTAGGCERCACVREEVDCSLLQRECAALKCNYGLARSVGDDGCERCKCLEHPCAGKVCPEGERCLASPFRDPIMHDTRYSADCRTVNKPGACPALSAGAGSTEGACRRECNDDADCRGVLKCCASACSQLCLAPDFSTTRSPEIPHAPEASPETETEVAATIGGKATLRCIFHANPPPKITWRFGEITIDSDANRYRLLSDGALEIISLVQQDSGVYICVASNELGSAQKEVTLQVSDTGAAVPAEIAGEPGAAVTGELQRPATVRCRAYGYPPPTIYWFRGHGGPMVPFSSALYEARGQELLIRLLTLETLGEYECQAYNGVGKAATWRVAVQAYQPDGQYIPGNRYLVPREERVVAVTPRAALPDTTQAPSVAPEPEVPYNYVVPVRAALFPTSTNVTAGAQLDLPCEVDGYPIPDVHWTKDNVVLAPTDRVWITGSRLTIPRTLVTDSGEYACHASNSYSSHTAAVQISVQDLYIPAKCVDNPTFANCALIVQSRFCRHTYYSRFCCKSCVEAGQLDPRDVEMQADAPFRKK